MILYKVTFSGVWKRGDGKKRKRETWAHLSSKAEVTKAILQSYSNVSNLKITEVHGKGK